MSIKNVNLVMFSPCGGTEEVIKAIARDITLPIREYDITLPKNRSKPLAFTPDDLVIFGFPVYEGRMPANINEILSPISGDQTPCVLVAVYGNRACEGGLLDLHKVAISKNFKPVAAISAIAQHSLAPQYAAGRPDSQDRERLADFGNQIVDLAQDAIQIDSVPGHFPDWKAPDGIKFFPITDEDKCNRCGVCVKKCPTDAIPAEKPYTTNDADCIACGACVKYCPQDARVIITPEIGKVLTSLLAAEFAIRKEAEIYPGK